MSFSFLSNLLDGLPDKTKKIVEKNQQEHNDSKKNNQQKQILPQAAKDEESANKSLPQPPVSNVMDEESLLGKRSSELSDKESEFVAKKYLKLGDVFKHAYDALKPLLSSADNSSNTKPQSGTSMLMKICQVSEKANSKLKGRSFLLKKNEILRGKPHLPTKKGVVSRKQIREQGLFEIKDLSWEDAKLLNTLWEAYIKKLSPEEIRATKSNNQAQNKQKGGLPKEGGSKHDPNGLLWLMRADFHGAYIQIIASVNSADIGIQGVVVKETLNTLSVCVEDQKQTSSAEANQANLTSEKEVVRSTKKVKTLIKKNIILLMRAQNSWYKILGQHLIYRGDDRSKLKPKWKNPLPVLDKQVFL